MKHYRSIALHLPFGSTYAESVIDRYGLNSASTKEGVLICSVPDDSRLIEELRTDLEASETPYRWIEDVETTPDSPFLLIDLENFNKPIGELVSAIASLLEQYTPVGTEVGLFDSFDMPSSPEDGVMLAFGTVES